MIRIYCLIILIVLFSRLAIGSDLISKLPTKIGGWESSKEDKVYDRKNIYDYLDGGAELYLAYNMEKLFSRRYKSRQEGDIVVDIFEMKTSKNAFGLFSHDYEGNKLKIGDGSVYEMGLLIFWQSRYYVSILAENESEAAKKAVFKLADLISKNISDSAKIPELMNRLKGEEFNLISRHYFQSHLCLNFYYYLSDVNILNLSESTEGAIGKYQIEDKIFYAVIIQYLTDKEAKDALLSFQVKHLKTKSIQPAAILKDGKWYACKQAGNDIVISLGCPSKEIALKLIATLK